MKAVVLDGELKSALAAARELHSAGIEVIAGSERKVAMTYSSRAATRHFVYPSPKKNQKAFVEHLKKIVGTSTQKPVVFAFSDATYMTLAEYAEELLPLCLFTLPNAAARERIFNKRATYDLANSLQIPTITELSVETAAAFPVVIKPRMSVSWQNSEGVFGTAEMVFDKKQLQEKYEAIRRKTGQSPIIQEFIIGDEYGVELLCDKGQTLLSFGHKRIRSLSPRGGAATVKETLKDESIRRLLTRYAESIAKAVNWTGPLMVELKYNSHTNQYMLMETNGRFWGSLPLALQAGVPFVLRYFEMLQGVTLRQEPVVTKEIRTQHLLGDVRWLLLLWFKPDLLREKLYPSRLSGTLRFFRDTLVTKKDVWSLKDPLPGFIEILQAIKK